MSNILRMCHTQNYDYFLEMDDRGRMEGVTAPILNQFIHDYITEPGNLTLDITPRGGFGEKIPGSDAYTGCLGRLQRNESDVLFKLVHYPLDVVNVTQGLIVSESGISMLPFYYHKMQITQQITDSFKSFSMAVWLFIVASLTLICFLLYLHSRMTVKMRIQIRQRLYYFSLITYGYGLKRKTRLPHTHLVYQVATHFFKVSRIEGRSLFHRLLFLQLSILSLVILHYFGTLIKTDLVVTPFPDVHRSYSDMMRANALPLFYFGFNDESEFINALEGTEEKTFWAWATKEQPNLRMMQIYPGTVDVEKYLDDVLEGKRVILIDNLMAPTFRKIFCQFQSKNPEAILSFMGRFKLRAWTRYRNSMPPFNVLHVRNPTSTELLSAVVVSGSLSKSLLKKCKKIATSIFEHANMHMLKALSVTQDPLKDLFGRDDPERTRKFEECMSDAVFTKDAHHNPLKYKQMFDLIKSMQYICIAGVLVLFCEIAFKRVSAYHRSKCKKIRGEKKKCSCGLKSWRRGTRLIVY